MENNLPSILGGMAQGFTDFGKGLFDMFGTGGASVLDLIESAKTGNVTSRRQDDFRKWLYQTDSTKDAAAKGLGTALNGVQTVADYIPGVNALTQTTLGNAAQGALGGLADELKTYGEDYDLGRAGQRAAISAAGAAVSGGLADALKGSNNALLSSNTVRGLARGATGGAISGGGYAAIDGGDVLEAAKQGAGMGALIGGATGAFQDFKPSKAYNVALTDDERAARIANAQKQIDDIGAVSRFSNNPDDIAKRARINELQGAIKAYQSGYDTVQDYTDAMAAKRANRANTQSATTTQGQVYTPDMGEMEYGAPVQDGYTRLYRGLTQEFDPQYNRNAMDNMNGYESWTDSYDLANRYGDGKYVYSIDVPTSRIANSLYDENPNSATYGNRNFISAIEKAAGLDGVDGNEYLLNTNDELRSGLTYNRVNAPKALETTLADADMAVNNPRYLTDENGNPRTFYHGSPNKNITEFDVNQAGKNTSSGEHALYFTDSPQVADDFSYERLPGDSMFIENKGAKGRVYPVNLEMNNPLDLDNLSDAQIRELWQYASPLGQLDGQEKFIRNLTDWRDNAHNAQLTKGYLDLDKLRDSQYDGFMARMYPNQDNQAREYAVFDNSKVKMLEDVLANDDMAVNNQTKGLGGSPDGAQNYRTFATGDEAREYFGNSNPGYWDKAPGYDDIQEYTRNGYSRVNDMLRTGQDNYGYPDTDIMIDNIERGIDGYDLKDDIKVYRKSNADVYKNLKVGDTFTDDGFTSASVTPEIGGDFGKANIEIDVGKGKGVGAFIGDLSSGYGDEGEFLLQRGTKYKVVGKDGDRLKLEVVGNERKPLEQILADQDLSVNSAKIAPGQLGLFDDMPTQAPKTGTRQTSIFDQPQEASAESVNPYAPVDGKLTQAMKDRYWDVMKNADGFGGAVDNELYNKIDRSTLPKGYDKLQQLLDSQMGEDNKVSAELRKGIGTDMPLEADLDRLVEYVYGDEINGKQTFYKDLDESVRLNKKNAPLIGIDAEQAEVDAKNSARTKLISRAIEKAERKVIDDVVGSGDSDDIMYALQDYRRRGVRTGSPGALDTVLSERLGIAPGNTVKVTDVTKNDHLSSGALGRYARSERNIALSDINSPEGKVSTMAHERLHSFQNESRPESAGRYSPEVAEAYKQLQKDLGHYYKSNSEIKKRYGRNVDYWASSGEQESRMFQQYLENKGYTDDSAWRKMSGKADEWGNEINPAFDKFIDKLRDLSKRGVALPALAALFGGGAYMASQENDKEKEVK